MVYNVHSSGRKQLWGDTGFGTAGLEPGRTLHELQNMVRSLMAASSPFQMKNYSPGTETREEGQDTRPADEGHLGLAGHLVSAAQSSCASC